MLKSDTANSNSSQGFDLESSLKLALCFYGDRFILWNFQLNRLLFEFRCGGANRSWDFEFTKTTLLTHESSNDDRLAFRFFYIKNRCIGEARKQLGRSEIERPFNQNTNHLCQIFHGNTISTCRFFISVRYLLTGAEDTQLIMTSIESSDRPGELSIAHAFRLQGHDSVVKCVDYVRLSEAEVLLVSAGGKANIKLWKVMDAHQHKETIKYRNGNNFKSLPKIFFPLKF
jgi:WD40 repeat protein